MSALPTSPSAPAHRTSDTQPPPGGRNLDSTDQTTPDTQPWCVGAAVSPPGPSEQPTPKPDPARADALLLVAADLLDDLERTRIANANRLRALTTTEVVGDKGGTFGKGIPADLPEVARLTGLVDSLAALEHGAELELKRAMRSHALGPWVARTKGVGEKQGARLIAAIGDPYWNSLHDRPRTVSELWSYCGYSVIHPGHVVADTQTELAGVDPLPTSHTAPDPHTRPAGGDLSSDPGQRIRDAQNSPAGVAPTRKKGQRANWNAAAKMRAFLAAEACMKAGIRKIAEPDDSHGYDVAAREPVTPLGRCYLDGRTKYAESTHGVPCVRCGPSGRPAPPGSPLSDGHKHARALRLVAKAVLRDLWLEARQLHEEQP